MSVWEAAGVLVGYAVVRVLAGWVRGLLERPRHRRTDPACAFHHPPRGPLGRWWFDRGRGKACPVCMLRWRLYGRSASHAG